MSNLKNIILKKGPPFTNNICNRLQGTKETWMQEAVKNPLPTSYRLRSIVEIFGPAFFKEEDGVDYENIKAELSDYLEVK